MSYENAWEGGKEKGILHFPPPGTFQDHFCCAKRGLASYNKVEGKQTNEGAVSHQPNAIDSQVHAEPSTFLILV